MIGNTFQLQSQIKLNQVYHMSPIKAINNFEVRFEVLLLEKNTLKLQI